MRGLVADKGKHGRDESCSEEEQDTRENTYRPDNIDSNENVLLVLRSHQLTIEFREDYEKTKLTYDTDQHGLMASDLIREPSKQYRTGSQDDQADYQKRPGF